jgi:hypothetical protein
LALPDDDATAEAFASKPQLKLFIDKVSSIL